MIMRQTFAILAGGAFALCVSGPADAAPIAVLGGLTEIEVTANLGAFGLTAMPTGTAGVNDTGTFPVFSFPITGGLRDDMIGETEIEHAGAGLAISNGTTTLTFFDFLIDAAGGEIRSDVTDGTDTESNIGFLTFDLARFTPDGGLGVDFNVQFGFLLDEVFGTGGNLGNTGTDFGVARLDIIDENTPSPVPLPASLPLLVAGLAGFGLLRRRRRAAAEG